jgi:hypothetical protein
MKVVTNLNVFVMDVGTILSGSGSAKIVQVTGLYDALAREWYFVTQN